MAERPDELSPDEQALFDELAARARGLEPEDFSLDDPPPEVWNGIEDQLFAAGGRGRTTRRAPTGRLWIVAAAAALVLVLLGTWMVSVTSGDGTTLIGHTELEALDEDGVVLGDAELEEVDGELRLRIETEELDPGDADYLEVWVIDPDVTELISLGPKRTDGTYELPSGFDPERFPIVDISREPLDGDPAHSGDSVVRGQLRFS